MKKIISVLLAVLMLFSCCSVAVSAAEADELVITVANDLHYNVTYTTMTSHKANSVNEDFAHIGLDTRLPHEAKAIIDAFAEQVKASDSDFLIIPGDITDRGKPEEVAYMVALFEQIEDAGIKVYVVPGNHDVVQRNKAQFMIDYADFGYNEALEKDTKSASYVVDLNDEYRLIAIDSTTEGTGAHSVYEERLQWISQQGEKAKAAGKKLIGMHHQNFLDHMLMSNLVQPNGVVTAKSTAAKEVYAKAGIKYVFTGHTHDHDIASYTAEDGTVIYDAVTGSLNALGSYYRVVTFGDNVKFETKSVDKIDVDNLPACISENAKAIAAEDFYKYQEIATNLSYYLVFDYYTTPDRLVSFLNIEDANMKALLKKVAVKLNEGLKMPFNKADETEEGKSIESLIGQYDLKVPATDYKNVMEVAVTIYQGHNLGDESFPAYSDEVVLISRGIGAVLGYALEDVSGEEYAQVMSFIVKLLGANIPVDFLVYAGDGISRFQGIEVLLTTVLVPLVVEFANDDAPGDLNVTLPGYAELVEETKELSFFEKLLNFFNMILDAIRTAFTFLPFASK